ncbi:hypothetical protein [Ruegeria sp. HKCCE3926]|uniref:hypothetical protein n=1 Tax=Ruegeria sp. HKCCE3926 TaxID=2794831 RepID=UPI001AE0F0BC|nr:hypothetical protein [Ruegeria sp. HKCCE3926]
MPAYERPSELKYVYIVISISHEDNEETGERSGVGVPYVFDNKEAAIETAKRYAGYLADTEVEVEISKELRASWIECLCYVEGKLKTQVSKMTLETEPDDDWEPFFKWL